MTKEEIFALAEKADLYLASDDSVINFAKLIAEHEREKFCAVLRQLHDSYSLTSDSNAISARGQE